MTLRGANVSLDDDIETDGGSVVVVAEGGDAIVIGVLAPEMRLPGEIVSGRTVSLYVPLGLGPEDVDVFQLYDMFAPVVLYGLEAYGFCKRGEGAAFEILPDYSVPLLGDGAGSLIVAGLIGVALLFAATRLLGRALARRTHASD